MTINQTPQRMSQLSKKLNQTATKNKESLN